MSNSLGIIVASCVSSCLYVTDRPSSVASSLCPASSSVDAGVPHYWNSNKYGLFTLTKVTCFTFTVPVELAQAVHFETFQGAPHWSDQMMTDIRDSGPSQI